jgi:glutamine synthetase
LERGTLSREALGDPVVDFYAHTARLKIQSFNDAVSDWERSRYFERITMRVLPCRTRREEI